MHSFMEGARLGTTVGLYRDVARPTVVEENGKTLNLRAGQRVLCNLVSRSMQAVRCATPAYDSFQHAQNRILFR